MTVEFRIVFDGDTPGLREHRLSIGQFGKALAKLHTAFRRAASTIVANSNPDSTGRLTKEAERIDLQLISLSRGSAALNLACELIPEPGEELPLLDSLQEKAAIMVLRDIRREHTGEAANRYVRGFIAALPAGVKTQRYSVLVGGILREDFSVEEPMTSRPTAPVPRMRTQSAQVAGVSFEPASPEVRFRPKGGGNVFACAATAEQVETALALRGEDVLVRYLERKGQPRRLLLIRAVSDESRIRNDQEREDHLAARWSELLRRLAQ